MSDSPVYLTTADLAARLRLRPTTLRAWRKRRTGPPYIRSGRKALYALADVEAWEKSQRVEPSGG